jgi:hypothetical protein
MCGVEGQQCRDNNALYNTVFDKSQQRKAKVASEATTTKENDNEKEKTLRLQTCRHWI